MSDLANYIPQFVRIRDICEACKGSGTPDNLTSCLACWGHGYIDESDADFRARIKAARTRSRARLKKHTEQRLLAIERAAAKLVPLLEETHQNDFDMVTGYELMQANEALRIALLPIEEPT